MHVAITGASSGIGEALAREYLKAGASVSLIARRKDRLEALAKEAAPGKCAVLAADLSSVKTCDEWLAPAEAALGPIDVLVNNAGIQIVGRTTEHTAAEGEKLLELDLLVPLHLTHRVLPGMLARRTGTIVDVSSLAGLAPTPGMYYYSAAKAGLGAASECLRGELRGSGVHVVTVYPGPIHTDMATRAIDKIGKDEPAVKWTPTGRSDVLARKIRRAVERRRSRVIYPWIYSVVRHFPNLTRWFMDAFSPSAMRTLGPPGQAK